MIKVHKAGCDHARALIEHGKVTDKPFTFDKADGDELLGPRGTHVEDFARHHLGEDDSADEGDHGRFRYPFAKEGRCYSRALRSICDRAREHGHEEVRASAQELIGLIEEGASHAGDGRSAPAPDAEKRYLMTGLQLRAAPDGKGPGMVVGYAAVFKRFSEDLGKFREQIEPGAFAGVMGDDVRALANHDPNLLLGRTRAGTLRMAEDGIGLRVEIDLPDTQLGRDIATSIRRGDMDGMSFSFVVNPGDDEWDFASDPPIRTVRRFARLYDIGPVTYPAYPDTSAAMRSLDRARGNVPSPSPKPPTEGEARESLASAKARQRLAEALLTS